MDTSRRTGFRPLRLSLVLCLLALAWLVGSMLLPALSSDPLTQTWATAERYGRYNFRSDVVEITHPTEQLANAGRDTKRAQLTIEGAVNQPDDALSLHITGYPRTHSSLEIEVRDGVAQGRTSPNRPWQPLSIGLSPFAPGGSPLAFLAAVKNVTMDSNAAGAATHFTFDIDGRKFAEQLRGQGGNDTGLPAISATDVAPYLTMTGHGELWLDANGLPTKQNIHLEFPAAQGALAWQEADVTTTYTRWAAAPALSMSSVASEPTRFIGSLFALSRAETRAMLLSLAMVVLELFIAGLIVRFAHKRRTYAVITVVVLASMFCNPLLGAERSAAAAAQHDQQQAQVQQAQDAAQAQQALASGQRDGYNPLQDPLAQPAQPDMPAAPTVTKPTRGRASLASSSSSSSDTACATDTDSDGDGLDNDVECYELGTDPYSVDSDNDFISDKAEVVGSTSTNGTSWYMNPSDSDSNGDGLTDGFECSSLADVSASGALTTASGTRCEDTDSDGVPDVFDLDNDGDGVPDTDDLNPNTYVGSLTSGMSGGLFSYDATLDSVSGVNTLFTEFQLRPTNADQLWQVNHVFDWPSDDEEGQITRKYDTTFYDEDSSYGSDSQAANGDVMLTPMLEIYIPYNSANPTGGLPLKSGYSASSITDYTSTDWIDTTTLDDYSITVDIADDAGTGLYVYVPLEAVTDSTGDTPVALSGMMLYKPLTTSWGSKHQAKVVWLVNMIVDQCDSSDMPSSFTVDGTTYSSDDDDAYDAWCSQDANWDTSTEVVQTYYEDFYVTGLQMREDHGGKASIVIQKDTSASYEKYLWRLVDVLQETYLEGQLVNSSTRLDANNIDSNYTNWGITSGKLAFTEATLNDQTDLTDLMATTAVSSLNSAFPSATTSQTATVLYAVDQTYRLGDLQSDDTTVTNDSQISLNLASQTLLTYATLFWMPYSYAGAGSWSSVDIDDYMTTLSTQLTSVFSNSTLDSLASGETISDYTTVRDGAILLAQNFYLALYVSSSAIVASGGSNVSSTTISNSTYSSETTEAVVLIVSAMLDGVQDFFSSTSLTQISDSDITASSAATTLASSRATILEAFGDVADGTTSSTATYLQQMVGYLSSSFNDSNSLVTEMGLESSARSTVASLNSSVGEWASITYASLKLAWSSYKIYKAISALGGIAAAWEAILAGKAVENVSYVGLVVDIAIAVGVLVYTIVANNLSPNDLEFSVAFASAYASILLAIIYFALAATVVGAVIVAIIKLIDAVMIVVCAVNGVDESAAVDTWVCSGISGIFKNVISYVVFDQSIIPDLEHDDRLDVEMDTPTITQLAENDGFVAGNQLNLTMGVTSTLWTGSPTSLGYTYIFQFIDSNLDDTKVSYALQTSDDEITGSSNDWTSYGYDILDQWSKPRMYQKFTTSTSVTIPSAGINQGLPVYLTEGVKADVQECWLVWVTVAFIPVCYIRTRDYADSLTSDLSEDLVVDILPATLDEFTALAATDSGGYRQSWDDSFPTLEDADGDGLRSSVYGGPDPDDHLADYDGDGLSDYYEYQNGYDYTSADADGDGLGDYWEVFYGTNPAKADSDSDGLTDDEEFFHPDSTVAYSAMNTTNQSWTGGWTVVYDYSGSSALSTRVSSDPNDSDTDDDSITDKYENIYGYNPTVANVLDVLNLDTTITTPNSSSRYVAPGQSISYEATISNDLDNRYASGKLEAEFPTDTLQSETSFGTLAPQGSTTVSGSVTVDSSITSSEALSMTMRAGAEIQDLSTGRVMWLKFNGDYTDSAYGTTTHDATCTSTSCPTLNTDDVAFINTNQLSIADSDDLDLEAQTLSMWVYFTNLGNLYTFYKKGSTGLQVGVIGQKISVTAYESDCTTSVTVEGSSSAYIVNESWYNIAITYDGSTLALYINGTKYDSTALASMCTNSSAITIGNGFGGEIDDIQLYGYALSSDQIQEINNQPVFYLSSWNKVSTSATGEIIYEDDSDNGEVEIHCKGDADYFPTEPRDACPTEGTGVVGSGFDFAQNTTSDTSYSTGSDSGGDYISTSDKRFSIVGHRASDVTADGSDFTIATWIKPIQATSDGLLEQLIIGQDRDGFNYAPPTLYVKGQNLIVRFGLKGNASYCEASTSSSPLTYSTWQHIAVTYDGTTFTLYLNGSDAGVTWTTNNNCSGVTAYSPSKSSPAWYGSIGHGQRTFIYFDSINNVTGGKDNEAYIWDTTNDTLVWDSGGSAIDSGVTLSINEWITLTSEGSLSFDFCNRDDSPSGAGCPGKDDLLTSQTYEYYSTQNSVSTAYSFSDDSSSHNYNMTLNYTVHDSGFVGSLDELALYRNSLSAAEVKEAYESTYKALELKADEAPGQSTFEDSSGNDLTITCSSSAGTCPESGLSGRDNQALSFDGSNDYLSTNETSTELGKGSFTLAAWVKTTGTKEAIITKSDGDSTWEKGEKSFYLNSSGQPTFVGYGNNYIYSTTAVNDGNWHYVAVVWNYTSSSRKIYVDGVDTTNTTSSNYAANNADNATDTLYIGLPNRGTNEAPNYFNGKIDSLLVSRIALSQTEISNQMANAPVLNLHLDENSGTSFADDSGYGTTFSCSGSACPDPGSEDAQIREAPVFDGDDTLTATANSALNLTNNYSISMWVKPTKTKSATQILFRKYDGTYYNYIAQIKSNTMQLFFYFSQSCSSSSLRYVSSTGSLTEDQWNQVAFTTDGSSLNIYINGVLDSTATSTTTDSACTTGSTFEIGPSFEGSIDEFVVYNTLLDATDIADLYDYQAAWYDVTQDLDVVVDADSPSVALGVSNASSISVPTSKVLSISAADTTSWVDTVEYRVNSGSWQTATASAYSDDGHADAWTFTFTPSGEGSYTIETKATDIVGHSTTSSTSFTVDNTAPTLDLDASVTSAPLAAAGSATLSGTISDSSSGVNPNATTVTLYDSAGGALSGTEDAQVAYPIAGQSLHLRFDEAADATSFSDSSSGGATISCTSCPTAGATGKIGNAISLSGSQYVQASGSTVNLSGGSFTQAVWMYPTFTSTGYVGVMGYNTGTLATRPPGMWVYQQNKINVGFGNGSTWTSITTGSVLTTNAWNHVVATFDGTTYTIYVNGSQIYSSTALSGRTPSANTLMTIGKVDSGFTGKLDEAAIYQRALTASEVTEMYQNGRWRVDYPITTAPYGTYTVEASGADNASNAVTTTLGTVDLDSRGPVAGVSLAQSAIVTSSTTLLSGTVTDVPYPINGLVAQFPFEEAVGATSFNDSSKNHLTATCSGTSCPTAGTSGKYNSALTFDGVDDYLKVTDTDLTELSTNATMMLWFKPTWTATSGDHILLSQVSEAGWRYMWAVKGTRDGLLFYTGSFPTYAVSIADNTWQHLAVTAEDGTVTFYLNGVKVASGGQNIQSDTGIDLYIGSYRGDQGSYFQGQMDDVTIYNHALSAEEIYAIANPLATTISSVKLRFRHAQDADEDWSAGTWHTATLASSASTATTWSYTITDVLEGPYQIDLETTDSLGNVTSAPSAWQGEIDNQAPRVTYTITEPSIECTATDYNLTSDNWACSATTVTPTLTYQSASWFTDLFTSTQKLATLSATDSLTSLTDVMVTACDLGGQCSTLVYGQTQPRPGGGTPLQTASLNIVEAAARTSSATPTAPAALSTTAQPTAQPVVMQQTAAQTAAIQQTTAYTEPAPLPADWNTNRCYQLGTDRRMPLALDPIDGRARQQDFYALWDAASMHLVWSGADWRSAGDLFIYLDTQSGGATQLFNPYTASMSSTVILPPTDYATQQPIGADYVVWVQENASAAATLLAWDGTSWQPVAGSWGYYFDGNASPPLTHIELPFATLGIADPASQHAFLWAMASDENRLAIWSTMPVYNNVSTPDLVAAPARDTIETFQMVRVYNLPSLGPSVCASGVDNSGQRVRVDPQQKINNNGAMLTAAIQSDPAGVAYALFRDNLIFLHSALFPGGVSSAQTALCQQLTPPLPAECRSPDDPRSSQGPDPRLKLARLFSVEHATVANGQTLTYAVRVTNSGDYAAQDTAVTFSTIAMLRLPGGQIIVTPDNHTIYAQTVPLGTMAPGETRTVTVTGIVDTSFNPSTDSWIHLRAVVLDETGGMASASEDIHLDHELDVSAPSYLELLRPLPLTGQGVQTFEGVVVDQSAVPTIQIEVAGQPTTCTDATPEDGRWSCAVDLGSRSDGATLPVRLRALDRFGHDTGWLPGPTLVVDTAAPSLALDAATADHLADSITDSGEQLLSGIVSDNHVVDRVEVCDADAANCARANLALSAAPTQYSYEDVPASPLPLGSANACDPAGSALVRTFTISDSFTLADVDVELEIAHPFRNDLVARLTSPQGTEVELMSHGADAANLNARFDDAALRSIFLDQDLEDHALGAAPVARRPYAGTLAAFRNQGAAGTWTLTLCDANPAQDDGTYLRSRLVLRPALLPAATSGTWSALLNLLPNRELLTDTLVLYAYDQSGNRSAPLTVTSRVDTSAPDFAVASTVIMSGTVTLSGTVDGSATGLRLDIRTPQRTFVTQPVTADAGTWSVADSADGTFRTAGTYCLWLRANDGMLNQTVAGPYAVQVWHDTPYMVFLPVALQASTSADTGTGDVRPPSLFIVRMAFVDPAACQ